MGDLSINFSRSEFACKCGCGFDTVDFELVLGLEMLRQKFGAPITINSGCRCLEYNERINGAKNSKHTIGRAADISISGIAPSDVYNFILARSQGRYGIGKYDTFVHFDTRSGLPARWDESSKKQ